MHFCGLGISNMQAPSHISNKEDKETANLNMFFLGLSISNMQAPLHMSDIEDVSLSKYF